MTAQQQFVNARTAPAGIVDPGAYSTAVGSLTNLPSIGGTLGGHHRRHVRLRPSGVSRLPVQLERRQRARHRPDHRPRDRQRRRHLGRGRRRRRLAAESPAPTNWTADQQWPALALLRRPRVLERRPLVRHRRGQHRRRRAMSAPASTCSRTRRTNATLDAGRRQRARVDHDRRAALRRDRQPVWAATLRGVWWHSTLVATRAVDACVRGEPGQPAERRSSAFTRARLTDRTRRRSERHVVRRRRRRTRTSSTTSRSTRRTRTTSIAAIGWRSGDTYNGFYETTDGGTLGEDQPDRRACPPTTSATSTFAFAADGSKLYAINQSPTLLNKPTGTVNSYLDGIYVSNSGSSPARGRRSPTRTKLANSGSALKQRSAARATARASRPGTTSS